MSDPTPHVVIVGGGFGGLYCAQHLRRAPVRVTLVDKRNFHLFQPLLYQVATGGLSPGDIASPLRAVLSGQKNTRVIQGEVVDVDPAAKRVSLRDGELRYDSLIVATGVRHAYFGHEAWASEAPGLKTIEDALEIRRRIFLAFEAAERETEPSRRRALLTFAVIGGGPTGVELAGALAELAYGTMRGDFRAIDTRDVEIYLMEGEERLLLAYPPALSARARRSLEALGVRVRTNTMVTGLDEGCVQFESEGEPGNLPAETVLWAAGVAASPLGRILAEKTAVEVDRVGRVIVQPDLSLPGHPDIFVIGDLARFVHGVDEPLPGVAPVAMQQGRYVARLVDARLKGRSLGPFRYKDKGNLAVIGRNRAVADVFGFQFSGFLAWFIWIFIHITYLIEYDNRFKVLIQWAADYFNRKRGARLITGADPFPLVEEARAAEGPRLADREG